MAKISIQFLHQTEVHWSETDYKNNHSDHQEHHQILPMVAHQMAKTKALFSSVKWPPSRPPTELSRNLWKMFGDQYFGFEAVKAIYLLSGAWDSMQQTICNSWTSDINASTPNTLRLQRNSTTYPIQKALHEPLQSVKTRMTTFLFLKIETKKGKHKDVNELKSLEKWRLREKFGFNKTTWATQVKSKRSGLA